MSNLDRDRLLGPFQNGLDDYTRKLKDSQAVLGTSLADIFLAGFEAGVKAGRGDAYRALNAAFENMPKGSE